MDDVEKLEQKEMKKKRPIKNTWYDWLINYVPELLRKNICGFKYKLQVFLRQTHLKNMVSKTCMVVERN